MVIERKTGDLTERIEITPDEIKGLFDLRNRMVTNSKPHEAITDFIINNIFGINGKKVKRGIQNDLGLPVTKNFKHDYDSQIGRMLLVDPKKIDELDLTKYTFEPVLQKDQKGDWKLISVSLVPKLKIQTEV